MNITFSVRKIDETLDHIIQEDLKLLKDIKKFVIASGGKRIRPILHLIFSDILGYKGKDRWVVGAITELIHAASLLHDDVVDGADTRRGKPTVGKNYGNKTAILAGDFLLACGIERLNRINQPLIMDSFTQVIRDLAVSELLQMQWEKNPKLSLDTYHKIIYGKTSSLFGTAVESAAILSGQGKKEAKRFHSFGILMGNIFQKRDDLLDYFSSQKVSGKDFLKDFNNQLYTYPLLVLKNAASSRDKKRISEIVNARDSRSIQALMEEYRIEEAILDEINEDIYELMDFLTEFPESQSKKLLLDQLLKLQKMDG